MRKITLLKQWLTVCVQSFSVQADCCGSRKCQFSQVFPKSLVEGVFCIINKTRADYTLDSFTVGGWKTEATFDKSPSFAADI